MSNVVYLFFFFKSRSLNNCVLYEMLNEVDFNSQERVVEPEAGVPDTAEALYGPSEAVSGSDQPEVSEV